MCSKKWGLTRSVKMNDLLENPEIDTVPDLPTVNNGQPTAQLPAIVDAASFIAKPLPEPDQLIAGVLHKGCKLALGGSSKSFKTWTLLDLALSVAQGIPWLNFETTAAPVLFCNFELQDWTMQKRIEAIARAKGITLKRGQLAILNLRGHAANYNLLLPHIRDAMKTDFGLCILDPIYKLYGLTDENKAGDVARLLNAIEELTVDTGAAVGFGSHYSKGNQSQKESIDRISGSGVFARDPDSLLTFTRHEDDDCFAVEATLRAFKPVEPFVVRWQYPLMRPDTNLDPARLKQCAGRKKEHDPLKLLAVIADTTPEKPISVSAWAHAGNVPRQTLTDYLPEMRRKGWVKTIGEGNNARQHITNDGKAFLNGGTHDGN
jgi:hypothetical protein